MDISVIVPVYCGEKTIEELFYRIKITLENSFSFEVIFVHDGGSDLSWDVICKLKSIYGPLVKAIRLTRNFGQHNATLCGIECAGAGIIVTMDEDLQHAPEDINKLIKCQQDNGSDLVYGNYIKRSHSIFRNFASRILNEMLRRTIPGLHKDYTSFRLLKRNIAKKITEMNSPYIFLDGYLAQITNKVTSISVSHYKSKVGKSSYSMKKLLNHSINILFSFSNYPARLLRFILFVLCLFFFSFGVYITFRKFVFNDIISGYSNIEVLLSFGIGFILLGLGIFSEYLKKSKVFTSKKPRFIIEKSNSHI